MSSEYKIEHDVALPTDYSGGNHRMGSFSSIIRELSRAKLGASLLVKDRSRDTISATARQVAGGGWYTLRKDHHGGFRIWKRAEPKQKKAMVRK